MSDNPFQAPQPNDSYGYPPTKFRNTGRTYVQQVTVIAALMIVQGVLLCLFALSMIVYAFFATQLEAFMPPDQPADVRAQIQQQGTIMSVAIGAVSVATIFLAVMHFMAAYFGFTLKYRPFGITTLIMGLCTSLTCYCAPTAIGLAVYGLIIYLNPAVRQAFAMAKSGMSKEQILEQFPH